MIMDFINSSEVDIAYHVLTEKGQTMYYKDLILEVIEKKHKPVQSLSAAISEVYTLINMDSRAASRSKAANKAINSRQKKLESIQE